MSDTGRPDPPSSHLLAHGPGDRLITDLRSLIEGSRQRVAQAVNSEMVLLYWRLGLRS